MAEHNDSYKILFSPYAVQKTGILCNRCKLHISDYTMACAPYRLSKETIEILLAIDQREYGFVQDHQKRFCFISLSFQNLFNRNSEEILMRTEILKLIPLKNKEFVYLVILKLTNCPPDISFLVDEYFKNYKSLESCYEAYKDKFIYIDAENLEILPVNTVSLISTLGTEKHILIYKFSTQKIIFLLHEEAKLIPEGKLITFRFYCDKCRFDVSGNVLSVKKYTPDAISTTIQLSFSPELTEVVLTYHKQVMDDVNMLQLI
jgi:hypothetical protein